MILAQKSRDKDSPLLIIFNLVLPSPLFKLVLYDPPHPQVGAKLSSLDWPHFVQIT